MGRPSGLDSIIDRNVPSCYFVPGKKLKNLYLSLIIEPHLSKQEMLINHFISEV
jgi:hypothetical protein